MISRFSSTAIAAVLIAGLLAVHGPAAAQDLAPLQDRVDRLERAMTDLKYFVHRGKPATPSGSSNSNSTATIIENDEGQAGGAQGKIAALEAEIRALTNRVEEINFTVRRLDDRLGKLVEDVDFRLTAIERNMASGGVSEGSGSSGGQSAGTASARPSGSSAPRSLGTVSQDAVNRVPTTGNAPAGSSVQAVQPARTAAVTRAPVAAPTEALQGTPEQRYDAAFGLLQSKRFGEAEAAFEQFVTDHPKHELAGNAQYWLGETHYVQGDHERAAGAFLEGYKNYRSSSKSPDNLLKLGMTLAILNQGADACAVFAELKDRYPNAQNSIKRRAKREAGKAGC
jgi:tol-pal system protein YbgF